MIKHKLERAFSKMDIIPCRIVTLTVMTWDSENIFFSFSPSRALSNIVSFFF